MLLYSVHEDRERESEIDAHKETKKEGERKNRKKNIKRQTEKNSYRERETGRKHIKRTFSDFGKREFISRKTRQNEKWMTNKILDMMKKDSRQIEKNSDG